MATRMVGIVGVGPSQSKGCPSTLSVNSLLGGADFLDEEDEEEIAYCHSATVHLHHSSSDRCGVHLRFVWHPRCSRIKLNMADSGALGQSVVYWIKDSLITVAFDNIQEEDLNCPLYLEKESNGVSLNSGYCISNGLSVLYAELHSVDLRGI
ncbi:hypothetical protein SLEP1_g57124 [Rubroshorea leprosula]|uniref:Uncharacterized protein n=1 Tax=Rubroshorea leprosula TaxID=152421 RepID=A0AAV5MKA9_9ROSI|nr:hypothetical protein SLEP1_g57124 [Rubroshorea leprosula]